MSAAVQQQEPWKVPDHWKRLDVAQVHEWQCSPLVPVVDGMIARGNFVFIAAQSQTGKTLLGLNIARQLNHGGKLFDRYTVTPVNRILYLMLEDPDRRARDRILDSEHEFNGFPPLELEQLIIHCAPGFKLTDDRAFEWLESVIVAEKRDVVFLDTYQKATPGLSSFDDEKQGIILHKLADLTRKHNLTLIVLDHIRKSSDSRGRRGELSLDDVKGTGGKAQNADCVILMDRTPDKKQIRFQSFSKDFDTPIRILLNVAPKNSGDKKFTFAGDLDAMGQQSSARSLANQQTVLEVMQPAEWLSVKEIVGRIHGTGFSDSSVKRCLKSLDDRKLVDQTGKGKWKRYCRIVQTED